MLVNYHSLALASLSQPILQDFRDIDRSIEALRRANETSAAMDRLGDGEVAEIFNAFQYGFLIKCLLNEEFESIAMAMERSRPAHGNRYTSRNSWLQTYLKQQNPFQKMKPHIEKVKDVIADTTTKLER